MNTVLFVFYCADKGMILELLICSAGGKMVEISRQRMLMII